MNSEKQPNDLIHESSPYLLQHAYNPVHWHAWNAQTLAKAVREDKLILVSIGYSTCHWCHVMERESFEDPEVAAIMNEHFINIKVDREERPDIDHIYMEAVQFLTGSGGWPLNCFLLPDGRPFFGGTYFPPEERYGRASWRQVLINISNAFKTQREIVAQQAEKLTAAIRNNEKRFIASQSEGEWVAGMRSPLPEFFKSIDEQFDAEHGGYGSAPKFPQSKTIDLLLSIYYYQHNNEALAQALFTVRKMIRGGIFDQLRGGFARYATDAAWLVPHFEKMLYDNALLVRSMADLYRITKDEEIKNAIIATLEFIDAEMTGKDGGFYSAIDADSEGVEGKFYVWKKSEIEQLLGPDADLFCDVYDVSHTGNWEHHNILHLNDSVENYCKASQLNFTKISQNLTHAKELLLSHRNRRIRPGTDDKILCSWNALMISAYAEAGMALRRESWIETAVLQHKKIKTFFQGNDGVMMHNYKDGKSTIPAMLDDYAFYIEALLSLFAATQNTDYLHEARKLADYCFEEFYDDTDGMFYFAGRHSENIVRKKDFFDSATPSGNAVQCRNLLVMGLLFDSEKYSEAARRMIHAVDASIRLYPLSFSYWAKNKMILNSGLEEVVIGGPVKMEKLSQINAMYSPGRVVMITGSGDDNWPLLLNKGESDESLLYLCKDYNCFQPVSTIEEFVELLKSTR